MLEVHNFNGAPRVKIKIKINKRVTPHPLL
jgi:hypothetical protein